MKTKSIAIILLMMVIISACSKTEKYFEFSEVITENYEHTNFTSYFIEDSVSSESAVLKAYEGKMELMEIVGSMQTKKIKNYYGDDIRKFTDGSPQSYAPKADFFNCDIAIHLFGDDSTPLAVPRENSPFILRIKENGNMIIYLDKLVDLEEEFKAKGLEKTKILCYEEYKIENYKKEMEKLRMLIEKYK